MTSLHQWYCASTLSLGDICHILAGHSFQGFPLRPRGNSAQVARIGVIEVAQYSTDLTTPPYTLYDEQKDTRW